MTPSSVIALSEEGTGAASALRESGVGGSASKLRLTGMLEQSVNGAREEWELQRAMLKRSGCCFSAA